ncbi:MAG TPA: malto-oligosyltrehalose synthase [Candidatus Binataceae bacterium]|nr:malto-oligosyltrehalose synthase [Candidatus Binataceae bacterium]
MTHPRATYRLQLHGGFGFDDAAGIADYLAELGISHVYCSPYLQAAPGSQHGYDVVDYGHVNTELGGADAHQRMCAAFRANQLGQLLDVVPNHMAIGGQENWWWWDVLENGPSSAYASYFDVDWDTPEARLRNLVLLPVLGKQYGRALEAGEIRVAREDAAFLICSYEHRFPVAPRSLGPLLKEASARCGSEELAFIGDALVELPLPTATDRASLVRRHRDKAVIGKLIARLFHERGEVASAVDEVIRQINSDQAALHAILERQNYRLAYWRAAGRDLGYRRFFDINTLVGLRMEDPEVFADTHRLILQWLAAGVLDGLRVDHIDGLREPERYLRRLRESSDHPWLLVEKILQADERLPPSWPVAGTSGYDFMNLVNGLFVDPEGEEPFTRLYVDFTGASADLTALIQEKKDLVMREILGSDLNRLTAMLVEICEQDPHHRDYTRHELHEALKAVAMGLPVYRTYVRQSEPHRSDADIRYINGAVAMAKVARGDLDPELLDYLGNILLLRLPGRLEAELALRFQQFTGPVMAKAVEDTAFYSFNRFVCLNEVGGDPGRFGTSVAEFNRACSMTQRDWPLTMLATSTHDTKRSEDVRARLALLSEIPEQWRQAVHRWSRMSQRHWGVNVPDRNIEYLIYQTLIGAWPIEKDRVARYVEKAIREAKQYTSWTNPNPEYERAVLGFVEGIFADRKFSDDLRRFVEPLIGPGRINSLAQVLLKLTAPGVPDFYQGSELWNFTLVDPDNRQPVDYASRRRMLEELRECGVGEIMQRADEGLPKLWTMRQALAARRCYPQTFGPEGAFTPIAAEGARAEHVIAFCRGGSAITIVPRLVLKLAGDWGDTSLQLPEGEWRDVMGGGCFRGAVGLSELTAQLPVCLLMRQ